MSEGDQPPIYSHPVEDTMEQAAAIAGMIPVAGSLASEIVRSIVARRQNHRLNNWLSELQADVDSLQSQLDEDYLRSDDFHDLFEEVVTRAADTRQEEKLNAYRAIFLNALTWDDAGYDDAAMVMRLVDRWDPQPLVVLRLFDDPDAFYNQAGLQPRNTSYFNIENFQRLLMRVLPGDWKPFEVDRVWRDLQGAYIHDMNTNLDGMGAPGAHVFERHITGFGRMVADLLRNPTHEV